MGRTTVSFDSLTPSIPRMRSPMRPSFRLTSPSVRFGPRSSPKRDQSTSSFWGCDSSTVDSSRADNLASTCGAAWSWSDSTAPLMASRWTWARCLPVRGTSPIERSVPPQGLRAGAHAAASGFSSSIVSVSTSISAYAARLCNHDLLLPLVTLARRQASISWPASASLSAWRGSASAFRSACFAAQECRALPSFERLESRRVVAPSWSPRVGCRVRSARRQRATSSVVLHCLPLQISSCAFDHFGK